MALVDAAPEASAPVAVVDAAVVDASVPDAAPSCTPTVLQHDACVTMHDELTLENEAIRDWLSARGAKPPEYTFETCRPAKLGADGEEALVCLDLTPLAVDGSIGMVGPVEHRYDLDVFVVRDKKRVELLRVPFSFGLSSTGPHDASDMFFSATYRLDEAAAAIELVAPKTECDAALAEVKPYLEDQIHGLEGIPEPPLRQQLVRAYRIEITSDTERIKATCAAAGRYVRADAKGKFVRAR